MKQIKTISIVGGGNLSKKLLPDIATNDYIIGVDRGACWLILNGVIPDIAIGDFDSVTVRQMQIIKKQSKRLDIYPKRKIRRTWSWPLSMPLDFIRMR